MSCDAPPARLAAPAAEDGRSEMQQRQHDRGRVPRRPTRETELDHLGETSRRARPPRSRAATTRASIAAGRPGSGTRKIVRAGWRSARPASDARACGSQRGGAQTTCVIVLVRSSGTRRPPARAAQLRQLALDVGGDAHDVSAAARSGRHGGEGRPPRRAPAAGRVVREDRPVAFPGADDRVDELPLLVDLVLAREQRRVAEHRVEDQPLVGLREAVAERAAVEEVHVHGADRHPAPGTFAPIASDTPSSGWTWIRRTFGRSPSPAISSNGGCGARWNWIAIVVSRRASRLPART